MFANPVGMTGTDVGHDCIDVRAKRGDIGDHIRCVCLRERHVLKIAQPVIVGKMCQMIVPTQPTDDSSVPDGT